MEKKYRIVFDFLFITLAAIVVGLVIFTVVKNHNNNKWTEEVLTYIGVDEENMTVAIALLEDFMDDHDLTKDMYDKLPGFKVDYFPDQNKIVNDGFGLMFTMWNDDLTMDFYNSFYVRTVENTAPLG